MLRRKYAGSVCKLSATLNKVSNSMKLMDEVSFINCNNYVGVSLNKYRLSILSFVWYVQQLKHAKLNFTAALIQHTFCHMYIFCFFFFFCFIFFAFDKIVIATIFTARSRIASITAVNWFITGSDDTNFMFERIFIKKPVCYFLHREKKKEEFEQKLRYNVREVSTSYGSNTKFSRHSGNCLLNYQTLKETSP